LKKAKDLGRTPSLTNLDEAPFKRQKLEVEYEIEGLAKEGDLRSPEDRQNEVDPSPLEVWSLKSVFEDQDELDPKLVLEKTKRIWGQAQTGTNVETRSTVGEVRLAFTKG
jgi:hypothetical protein